MARQLPSIDKPSPPYSFGVLVPNSPMRRSPSIACGGTRPVSSMAASCGCSSSVTKVRTRCCQRTRSGGRAKSIRATEKSKNIREIVEAGTARVNRTHRVIPSVARDLSAAVWIPRYARDDTGGVAPILECLLGLHTFELLPVEDDAVTGAFGGNRLAVIDPHRIGDVAVDAEAVGLEEAAVGTGGQQMHRHVVRAVRGDRQVEGLGEVRDLHEHGRAA